MVYEIFKDGESINTIVADETFVKTYCEENGYTYTEIIREDTPGAEPEPTEMERLRADLDYIAALTGVEL